ncbi:MAG: hypothetical protein GF317_12355 [Candidatus Lokiarchaeota archaeon]|nr:hypothetical protein [Candidatus Lokiarchaeota archaeon]MBD3200440.1 hypothetical protein [Candidatus Lokiarchaeota archaeon]
MVNHIEYNNTMKNPLEELCYVYILYFDEAKGHVPLLMFPNEELKENKKFMRPIKFHPIWFLDIEESEALDHIDLEYKGYTFFGKKLLTISKRKKRRAGLDEDTPETIVIIISLPNDLDIFGDDLIGKILNIIKDDFEEKLYEVIQCEIAKEEVIKTPKVKECIAEGEKIKKKMRDTLRNTCKEFFSSVIKQTDSTSIKKQKAVSFLALKGVDFSHILEGANGSFSNLKIFDPNRKSSGEIKLKRPFEIMDIHVVDDSHELEIMVRNNTENEYENIMVKITHVKEFFEKEVMNQMIEEWYPEEELLFISPIIPHINEYLFFLIQENDDQEKLLTKKIDVDTLKKD